VGIPVVNITAVPTVSKMVGVSRILRGGTVTNLLGDEKISPEQEKDLRKKYILRALEILQMKIEGQELFTLDGTI
jgi:betaine reductase